jgi:choline-sulfatase
LSAVNVFPFLRSVFPVTSDNSTWPGHLFLSWLVIATVAISTACDRQPSSSARPERPNVLLVTIDTLRADHVGCYGYRGAATPTIDAVAERGVRFETAIAHVPLTGPSHASVLTGKTPLGHGFRNNSGFALPAGVRTAAEDFRAAGYRTAAFVSGFPLDRRFGLDRGFDPYDDHLPRGHDPRRTPYVERFADATSDAVLRWLQTPGGAMGSPWFLWVHYYDPHAPYEPPPDLAARYAASPYDGEIASVDRQLARVLQAVEGAGALARTIVLITADHGESLGEHGEGTHGLFLYDATLRVPWVMAGPGVQSGRVVKTVARLIDVLPTLVDYAGLPPPPDVEGRSLRGAAEGQELADAPAYAESLYSQLELGWAPLFAWRTARFKFIEAPTPELYDLVQDASETSNRIADQRVRAHDLRRTLQAALSGPMPDAAQQVDADTARRLSALGYISGGAVARRAGATGRDPKDGVHLLPPLNRGMSAARTDPAVAIRDLTAVLNEEPDLLMARRTRAVAYAAAGRHAQAIADLRVLEKAGQLSAEDRIVLADNLRFAGDLAEAARVLEATARDSPKFVQPWLSLAEVHIAAGRHAEAEGACRRALDLAPDHLEAQRRLGDLALRRNDLDGAAARYARILELDPTDAAAMSTLGVVRVRNGRIDEGIALFRRATARDPANGDAWLYLAGALASSGRPGEAVPYFERALAAGPRSTMALNGLGLSRMATGDRAGAAAAFRESLRIDPKQADVARRLADLRAGGL